MPEKWTRHPLLAAASLSGDSDGQRYAPSTVQGWTISDQTGEPVVPDALTLLEAAAVLIGNALPTGGKVVELDQVDDVISARLLASLAAATITRVRAWAVYTTYADGWGLFPKRPSVWSSHFSREDAERWLAAYQTAYADTAAYEWHLDEMPVDPGTLRRPGAEPTVRR